MSKLKINFLYNLILTISGYVLTFLTFPYLSRVLGVEKIGICSFVDSAVNYFILLSMLGLTVVGIREVANVKSNRVALSNCFGSLFFLHMIFTLLAILIMISLIFLVDKFREHQNLMFIGVLKLLLNLFLVEWFYKGIENFKFITSRSLFIKVIYAVSLFVFVREENDYYVYYILSMLLVFANSAINIVYLKRFICYRSIQIDIKRYLKPFFTLGIYILLTSLYTSFNVLFLGFIAGDVEVGYYTTATKLYAAILALFTSFTSVMLPRMSALIVERKMDEFNRLIQKSFSLVMDVSFPIIVFTTIYAAEIINLFAGNGYEGAIIPMQIIMPLVLIVAFEQILIIQILMPGKQDKAILKNSCIGATIGIILNIVLVSAMKSIGSAIVGTVCEVTILLLAIWSVNKHMQISLPMKPIVQHLMVALFSAVGCFILRRFFTMDGHWNIVCGGTFLLSVYILPHLMGIRKSVVLSSLIKR